MRLLAALLVVLALSSCALFRKGSDAGSEAEAAASASPTPAAAATPAASPEPKKGNFITRLWEKIVPPKPEDPPAAKPPVWIGTIKVISDRHNYVLIDSQPYYALEPGTILYAVGEEKETATLRVTADRDPPFFIADVEKGSPAVGNKVYSPSL